MHVAIIGAYGSAGSAVAGELLEQGDESLELTLIDDGEPGGGLCILRGCMPSKEVLSAGAHRFQVRHDDRLSGFPDVDAETVVETKNEHTGNFASHRRASIHEYAERENVEFIHDRARFVSPHTLAVGDRVVEADYVVIATGSSVFVPELPGLADRPHAGPTEPVAASGLTDTDDPTATDGGATSTGGSTGSVGEERVAFSTSREVLDATEFPDSGIVMGFGYIGVELVPYLREVGDMDLTVIEHDERPLDEADPAFGEELLELYREEFDIDILTETEERAVEVTDEGGVRMTVERHGDDGSGEETIEADELFLFTGREPSLSGFGIENTDLDPTEELVDATMQAYDDPRTFVVGDVNAREQILHVAKEQGFTAARNVLAHDRGEELEEYHNIHHHVIFSGLGVYPYTRVGHSIESAEAAGIEFVSATTQAADDGVFKAKDVPEGLGTLVVGTDGTVLGYQGLHYHADVMAKTMQIAVELGLDVRDLPDRAYHPTTPEILDGLFGDTVAQLE